LAAGAFPGQRNLSFSGGLDVLCALTLREGEERGSFSTRRRGLFSSYRKRKLFAVVALIFGEKSRFEGRAFFSRGRNLLV